MCVWVWEVCWGEVRYGSSKGTQLYFFIAKAVSDVHFN